MTLLSEVLDREQRGRSTLDRLVGEARSIAERGKALEVTIAGLERSIEVSEMVSGLLNTIGEERQAEAQSKLEELVTRGLQTIFGEELSFHVVQDIRGSAPTVDFLVRSKINGVDVSTPVMDARGGGLAAVVGFLVRLVVLLLSPNRRQVIFLDETFGHVSVEYEPRLAEFIREIVDATDVQIVLVTHSTAFSDQSDKLYQFSQKDGVTYIRSGASA